eukprot:TRINITY_DN856_c0_g1_i1.p1 TRINITY_DN856_c0_g1~~TRINITY_DN856_c0_g1_i1.p1  ORF type:complete len:350 (-),score=83.93 TRINITY_DN856_c0_g1_i1:164-1213(-)
MSAVIVDMYRGHEMESDDGESKITAPAAVAHAAGRAGVHSSVSVEDVHSFLAAHQKVGTNASSRSTRAVSDPPKRKRTSRTYQFNERDIRRYQQAKKEGRLRFPDLFMYHIQRPTDDVQREARMMRIHEEQKEAERIAAEIAEAASKGQLVNESQVQVIGMDEADVEQVKVVIMNQIGNAGIVTLEEQQHSPHHCDESMALKSEATAAGKPCVGEDVSEVRVAIASSSADVTSAAGITKTHEDLVSKDVKQKKTTKYGKIVLGEKFGRMGKKAIPVMIVAAAGFVSVVIITSSVGIGFAVAVPCAAITYGSIKLYEHCRNKRRLTKAAKHKKNGSIAESAPLAKIELAE